MYSWTSTPCISAATHFRAVWNSSSSVMVGFAFAAKSACSSFAAGGLHGGVFGRWGRQGRVGSALAVVHAESYLEVVLEHKEALEGEDAGRNICTNVARQPQPCGVRVSGHCNARWVACGQDRGWREAKPLDKPLPAAAAAVAYTHEAGR